MNQKIPLDECLVEYRNDNGQIYMRFEDGTVLRLAEASQRSETGTRDAYTDCLTIVRSFGGEVARRIAEAIERTMAEKKQAGSETPSPRELQRTAGDVIREFRESGSQDWGQLESAINYWAMTDFCPRFMGERGAKK